jgi:hypothetical protein
MGLILSATGPRRIIESREHGGLLAKMSIQTDEPSAHPLALNTYSDGSTDFPVVFGLCLLQRREEAISEKQIGDFSRGC